MRYTKRDIEIIEYIKRHKAINTTQLKKIFNINDATVSRRMKFIVNNSNVKKYKYISQMNFYDCNYKELIPNNNIYYWNRKPSAIIHTLLVNEVCLYLMDNFNIIEYVLEYPIIYEDIVIRADIYIRFIYEGKEYEYLIEVENNKGFNSNKYLKLQENKVELPNIIVLSDRRLINKTNYKVIKGRLNLSDLEKKIKQDIIESQFGYRIKK